MRVGRITGIPTAARTDLPDSLDERSLLLTMLDYTRRTAIAKCEGLSDEDAARAVIPTSPLMTRTGSSTTGSASRCR